MAGTGSKPGPDGTMPQIVKTNDALSGDSCIKDHRIGVHRIYQQCVESDNTPEAIATSYEISVVKVHAALACTSAIPRNAGN